MANGPNIYVYGLRQFKVVPSGSITISYEIQFYMIKWDGLMVLTSQANLFFPQLLIYCSIVYIVKNFHCRVWDFFHVEKSDTVQTLEKWCSTDLSSLASEQYNSCNILILKYTEKYIAVIWSVINKAFRLRHWSLDVLRVKLA